MPMISHADAAIHLDGNIDRCPVEMEVRLHQFTIAQELFTPTQFYSPGTTVGRKWSVPDEQSIRRSGFHFLHLPLCLFGQHSIRRSGPLEPAPSNGLFVGDTPSPLFQVNNCVGVRNHRHFIAFLFSTSALSLHVGLLTASALFAGPLTKPGMGGVVKAFGRDGWFAGLLLYAIGRILQLLLVTRILVLCLVLYNRSTQKWNREGSEQWEGGMMWKCVNWVSWRHYRSAHFSTSQSFAFY